MIHYSSRPLLKDWKYFVRYYPFDGNVAIDRITSVESYDDNSYVHADLNLSIKRKIIVQISSLDLPRSFVFNKFLFAVSSIVDGLRNICDSDI